MKIKPIVIGIVAPKEAGKTTSTNMISEFVNIRELAFADKLKNVCSEVFKIDRKYFDDQSLKEENLNIPVVLDIESINRVLAMFDLDSIDSHTLENTILRTPRKVAQIVGTNLLREIDNHIHINSIQLSNELINVISDTRFKNEFTVMVDRDDIEYHPVYIYRKEAEDRARLSDHQSEKEFLGFKDECYLIDNNQGLRELELNIKMFLDNIVFKRG